jgi:hypothetical protein
MEVVSAWNAPAQQKTQSKHIINTNNFIKIEEKSENK